jgi:hypothetical protein
VKIITILKKKTEKYQKTLFRIKIKKKSKVQNSGRKYGGMGESVERRA